MNYQEITSWRNKVTNGGANDTEKQFYKISLTLFETEHLIDLGKLNTWQQWRRRNRGGQENEDRTTTLNRLLFIIHYLKVLFLRISYWQQHYAFAIVHAYKYLKFICFSRNFNSNNITKKLEKYLLLISFQWADNLRWKRLTGTYM